MVRHRYDDSPLPAALATPLFILALLAGCGGSPSSPAPAPTPTPTPGQVTNFSLNDVNPASATFGRAVSPRDFQGQVSGWYFGTST